MHKELSDSVKKEIVSLSSFAYDYIVREIDVLANVRLFEAQNKFLDDFSKRSLYYTNKSKDVLDLASLHHKERLRAKTIYLRICESHLSSQDEWLNSCYETTDDEYFFEIQECINQTKKEVHKQIMPLYEKLKNL